MLGQKEFSGRAHPKHTIFPNTHTSVCNETAVLENVGPWSNITWEMRSSGTNATLDKAQAKPDITRICDVIGVRGGTIDVALFM